MDVLTANILGDDVSFFRNEGGGSLAAPVNYPIGDTPSDVTPCDLDDDGDLDIVVPYSGGIRILANVCSPGDLNCDGTVNAFDIEPFLLALFSPQEYSARFPNCNINNADVNSDGNIDAFDIEPFLHVLFG